MDAGEVMLWLCDLDFLFRTNLCVVKFTWIDRIVRWFRCSCYEWELMKVVSLKLYHYSLRISNERLELLVKKIVAIRVKL